MFSKLKFYGRERNFLPILSQKNYENNCDSEILLVAQQKVGYLKSKNLATI